MDKINTLLVTNPIFGQLTDTQREAVAAHALVRRYHRGEFITLYGDEWPYLLLLGAGSVAGVKESREGRRLIVISLKPGDVFWGMAFFNPAAPMPVTLEALDDARVYMWPQETLLPILLQNSAALWELCRLMIARMQQASQIVEGLAFQPVASRLARLVLDRFGDSVGTPVARDLTLDEMAALVGTTREVVCRLLYQFSDEKLIHITRTEFVVTDRDGLVDLAEQ